MSKNLQPIRGFRDLYPQEKRIQDYIFEKLKKVAALFGFEAYDGPLLEQIDLYLGKTSEELIKRQTFQITYKKEKTLVMRPEMTPSLARMIAQREQQLIFPLRLFNLGLRYRYEAPQKGREREFYQADFDILESESVLADVEILNVVIAIFLQFGADEKDFVVYINSRTFIQKQLYSFGIEENKIKKVIEVIDKKEKVGNADLRSLLIQCELNENQCKKIIVFLNTPIDQNTSYFKKLFDILHMYNISKYIKINPSIVRGLDYYTGLVFEVKEKGGMTRSLMGGGRYDNLIADFGASRKISGVGFATSDVILWEFLKDKNLIPELKTKLTKVLVAVFPQEKNGKDNVVGDADLRPLQKSIAIVNFLRHNNIPSELYPETDKKLDKQLKYADKNKIPFVIIIGHEEIKNNVVKIKNMKTREQTTVKHDELTFYFKNENC